MKKLFFLIIILVLIFGYFIYYKQDSVSTPTTDEIVFDGTFRPDPVNATFSFSDGDITFRDGKYTRSVAPGSSITEETSLTDMRAYGDLNADKKNDTAVILIQSGGASGVFIYLGGYVSGPLAYKGTNAIFLGDRITPRSVSIERGIITVSYLDRKDDEPFAAEPTVPVSKKFVFENNILVER